MYSGATKDGEEFAAPLAKGPKDKAGVLALPGNANGNVLPGKAKENAELPAEELAAEAIA